MTEYWADVAQLRMFSDPIGELAVRSVLASFPGVTRTSVPGEIDWNRALLAASLAAPDASEEVFDGSLRIAQGCLQSADTSPSQRDAAAVVLTRLGNLRSTALAQDKGLLEGGVVDRVSFPLQLDMSRRRMTLEIETDSGELISVNPFQADFWAGVLSGGWVSVSAPTSAGKSFIVRKWIEEQFAAREEFTAVYVVPTRALIDEVSSDLATDLVDADIFSLPWDKRIATSAKRIFVLTQERLHLLENKFPNFAPEVVFVDEAHKIGDGPRGVLLQRVLDELSSRRSTVQVVFASPLTSNPEILLDAAPGDTATISSEMLTVNQNLLYADQVRGRPTQWTCTVIVAGTPVPVGSFNLPARPQPASKRLPLVAVALGGEDTGNVVYANTAASAEDMGDLIYDLLGADSDLSGDPDVSALRDLVLKTVHPNYRLRRQLARGVAFHYGNMPLLVREAIESLFRIGKLRYLVCTSTLLEGVNLPCKNLFVRAPRRGNGHPMTPGDFWNLAGRAGRWGIEFQGNIVCVDVSAANAWENVPLKRDRQTIARSASAVMDSIEDFLGYISRGTPLEMSRANRSLEATYSLLSAWMVQGRQLDELPWMRGNSGLPRLEAVMADSLELLRIPSSLIVRHAGISAVSMDRLAAWFSSVDDLTRYQLPLPESDDFVDALIEAMGLINRFLGGDFGANSGHHWQLAVLIARWMRGIPLSYLISDRVSYFARTKPNFNLASAIRSVMNDIEQMARFQAPLYLTCYLDVLSAAMQQRGLPAATEPDFAMMLELGVSRETELSMISLGLSRTTAVALSDFIAEDTLSPTQAVEWLRSNGVENLDLPELIKREVLRVLERSARIV